VSQTASAKATTTSRTLNPWRHSRLLWARKWIAASSFCRLVTLAGALSCLRTDMVEKPNGWHIIYTLWYVGLTLETLVQSLAFQPGFKTSQRSDSIILATLFDRSSPLPIRRESFANKEEQDKERERQRFFEALQQVTCARMPSFHEAILIVRAKSFKAKNADVVNSEIEEPPVPMDVPPPSSSASPSVFRSPERSPSLPSIRVHNSERISLSPTRSHLTSSPPGSFTIRSHSPTSKSPSQVSFSPSPTLVAVKLSSEIRAPRLSFSSRVSVNSQESLSPPHSTTNSEEAEGGEAHRSISRKLSLRQLGQKIRSSSDPHHNPEAFHEMLTDNSGIEPAIAPPESTESEPIDPDDIIIANIVEILNSPRPRRSTVSRGRGLGFGYVSERDIAHTTEPSETATGNSKQPQPEQKQDSSEDSDD
jgi:hypothetical protein